MPNRGRETWWFLETITGISRRGNGGSTSSGEGKVNYEHVQGPGHAYRHGGQLFAQLPGFHLCATGYLVLLSQRRKIGTTTITKKKWNAVLGQVTVWGY